MAAQCLKVKCLHCGYVRAKNTTRQIEHLQECEAYLNSHEAASQASALLESLHPAIASSPASAGAVSGSVASEATRAMLNGTHPNPNLQVVRRGPGQKRKDPPTLVPAPARTPPGPPAAPSSASVQLLMAQHPQQPSLTSVLLRTNHDVFTAATQQPFLSHAGCGTLAAAPLVQWMVQDGHYTRAYLQFLGALIAKIRLPPASNPQFHPMYRTMDLLISAINNIRREMRFFEITATKYSIQLTDDAPNFVTRSYLDLFSSVSAPGASLLEGLVVLWATEHARLPSRTDAWANPATGVPLLLDLRAVVHDAAAGEPRRRVAHCGAASGPDPELDLGRVRQVRQRLPRPRRRPGQLAGHQQRQGGIRALRDGLPPDLLARRALLAQRRRHGRRRRRPAERPILLVAPRCAEGAAARRRGSRNSGGDSGFGGHFEFGGVFRLDSYSGSMAISGLMAISGSKAISGSTSIRFNGKIQC
jgi:hypothetical protein